jgi:hypothetical protein
MNSNSENPKTEKGQPRKTTNSKKRNSENVNTKAKAKALKRTKKTPIELVDLPPEILLKIIGYLSLKDIKGNVRHVSKWMRQLSEDPSVGMSVRINWKSSPEAAKDIFKSKQSSQVVKEMTLSYGLPQSCYALVTKNISSLHNLMVLNISVGQTLSSAFLKQVFQLKVLTELKITDVIEESSLATIDQCQSLNSLALECSISEQELMAITNLRNLSKLLVCEIIWKTNREVEFRKSHCEAFLIFDIEPMITESQLDKITSSFPNAKTLRIYGGSFQIASRGEILALVTYLGKCKKLISFNLDCKLNDRSFFYSHFTKWKIQYHSVSEKLSMSKILKKKKLLNAF